MRVQLLACVASVAAYSPKTHLYHTTDLWRDADVPSLRPVPMTQSPAARQIALLAGPGADEDPNNTTYCVAHSGQTMVDDKWCFMSCNNVPPNCPPDLCDCVKGQAAKTKVDKVKDQLKATENQAETAEAKKAERDDGGLEPSRVQEEETAHKLARLVHRQQAVHQKEQPGQLAQQSSGVAQTAPSRAKSEAERKYDEAQAVWAVKDWKPAGEDTTAAGQEPTVESKSAVSFLQTEATQAAADDLLDQNPSCKGWAAKGECLKNPSFMASECAASCSGTEAAAAAAALAEWGQVQSSAGADSKASSVTLLQSEVRQAAAGDLLDQNPSCEGWAAEGECTKNPSFMASDCAASCRAQTAGADGSSASVDLAQPEGVDSRRAFAQLAGLIQPDVVQATDETHGGEGAGAGQIASFTDLVAAVAQTVVDKKVGETKLRSAAASAAAIAAAAKSKAKSKGASTEAVVDDTDGANLTTNSTKSCPSCGFKDVPNCCSKGATWEGNCTAVATASSFSWEDGFNACRGLHVAMQRAENMARSANGTGAGSGKKKMAAPKEKKCDSEREEWCDGAGDGDNDLPEGADPLNCVAVSESAGVWQHGQSAPLAAPQLGSCTSLGHAW